MRIPPNHPIRETLVVLKPMLTWGSHMLKKHHMSTIVYDTLCDRDTTCDLKL